jgi:hypothetical protein
MTAFEGYADSECMMTVIIYDNFKAVVTEMLMFIFRHKIWANMTLKLCSVCTYE